MIYGILCLFLGERKPMKLTEMKKRMLYQTEETERYAVLQEMSMASQYAGEMTYNKFRKL